MTKRRGSPCLSLARANVSTDGTPGAPGVGPTRLPLAPSQLGVEARPAPGGDGADHHLRRSAPAHRAPPSGCADVPVAALEPLPRGPAGLQHAPGGRGRRPRVRAHRESRTHARAAVRDPLADPPAPEPQGAGPRLRAPALGRIEALRLADGR